MCVEVSMRMQPIKNLTNLEGGAVDGVDHRRVWVAVGSQRLNQPLIVITVIHGANLQTRSRHCIVYYWSKSRVFRSTVISQSLKRETIVREHCSPV